MSLAAIWLTTLKPVRKRRCSHERGTYADHDIVANSGVNGQAFRAKIRPEIVGFRRRRLLRRHREKRPTWPGCAHAHSHRDTGCQ